MNTPTINLTKEYFIKKFKAIPDENWLSNGDMFDINNPAKGCALYHLGVRWEGESNDVEADALAVLLRTNLKKIAKTHPIAKMLFDKKKKDISKEIIDDNSSMIYVFNDCSPKYDLHPKQSLIMALEAI
jgi:hypothetical protein